MINGLITTLSLSKSDLRVALNLPPINLLELTEFGTIVEDLAPNENLNDEDHEIQQDEVWIRE